MHGLGDSAEGIYQVVEYLSREFKNTRFIIPSGLSFKKKKKKKNSPEKKKQLIFILLAPRVPVTLNGGMIMPSWYDICSLSDRSDEKFEGLEQSCDRIVSLIEKERRDLGDDNIILGGKKNLKKI